VNTAMNGELIDFIDLDPRWTQSGNPERIRSGIEAGQLKLCASHHGDHDQFWIVDEKADEEVRRFHVGGVRQIVWTPKP